MLVESFVDQVLQKIEQAPSLYYRLILLVGPTGSGKTASLRALEVKTGAPLLNINLELSRRMLDLTERQRPLAASNLLSDILASQNASLVLLDNIELLFDKSLQLDPLRLLLGLSRNITLIVAWNGAIEHDQLIYATPDHPDYHRYPVRDFLFVDMGTE